MACQRIDHDTRIGIIILKIGVYPCRRHPGGGGPVLHGSKTGSRIATQNKKTEIARNASLGLANKNNTKG
jgi:hypothetical protein